MEKLREIVSSVLVVPNDDNLENLSSANCEDWTSIAQVTLVVEIENAFNIELEMDEAMNMDSFAKIKEILANHGIN